MKKATIVIDYTNDFIDDQGALTCGKPGQDLEDFILKTCQKTLDDKDLLVFAVDVHKPNDPYHPESKLFPSHNVRGSWGRDQYGRLEAFYQNHKDSDQVIYRDKTRYSAFAGTDLDLLLRSRGIQTVVLMGVCTDICILHTAVDAYNLGYQIEVYEQGVASFSQEGHHFALNHFTSCLGAKVIK